MEYLVEKIYEVQRELVNKGFKTSKALKLKDEDTSLHFNHRCWLLIEINWSKCK